MKTIVLLALLATACGTAPIAYSQNNGVHYLTIESSGDDTRDFNSLSDRARNMCRSQGAQYVSVLSAQGSVRTSPVEETYLSSYTMCYVCR